MIKSVMREFFSPIVAEILSNNLEFITDTTYALIEGLKNWKSKLVPGTEEICFELLRLISDMKESFTTYISTCVFAKNLKKKSYEIFQDALQNQ